MTQFFFDNDVFEAYVDKVRAAGITIPIVPGLNDETRLIDPSTSGSTGKGGTFAVAEALRSLRTNLQFMDVDHPPKTIVVTSPLPGDGKSTVACNLALTLAAAGTTVVLELEGSAPYAFTVNDAGRGERLGEGPADPDVLLRMDREALIRLAGGRRDPEPGTMSVAGDEALAGRILDAMATTP